MAVANRNRSPDPKFVNVPSSKGAKERGCGFHVAVGFYLEACFSRVAEGYCGRYAAGLLTEPPLVLM